MGKAFRTHGFTLAEVFITLMIIGIIAAMTIPQLISKQQDYAFRVAMKKKYAELSTAMRLMENDGNQFFMWDPVRGYEYSEYYTNPQLFENYFRTRGDYNVLQKSHIYYMEFFTYFYNKANAKQKLVRNYNGRENDIWAYISQFGGISFQMEDGSLVYFSSSGYLYGASIVVDVNGPKGPNTIAKDIWQFKASRDGDGVFTLGPSNITNECYKQGSGIDCSHYVLNDLSYKIPNTPER